MTSELLYFGLTQKTAPLSIRESLRVDREAQLDLLSRLSEFCTGRIVLGTCERLEIYASVERTARDAVACVLMRALNLSSRLFSLYVRTLAGPLAATHFLRVAAGLDSRIVGERQILGQVRNAYQTSLDHGALDAQLSVLARTAIRAGKRVRNETALNSDSRSIVTLAMEWLANDHENLEGKRIAVVGSGRLAALVVSEVTKHQPRQIIITGRSATRAEMLAKHHGTRCADISELRYTTAESDIVFACTASPTPIIDASLMEEDRPTPLRLIDLCVPRNVDPRVSLMPFATLTHLDDMFAGESIAGRTPHHAPALQAVMQAEEIVQEELTGFLRWQHERQAVPMITDLLSRSAATSNTAGKRALHEQIMRLKSGVAV